jgi:TM2 domain-containing membrane protein YozV
MALIRCPDCGELVSDAAYECPDCARPMSTAAVYAFERNLPTRVQHSGKEKPTATLLALLLGGLGIHRFYLGRPVSGLVYLLFCWTFIPMLLGWGEFVRLLFMNEVQFHHRYSPPDSDRST